jgi:ferritin-like protein
MSSETLHEDAKALGPDGLDHHRAVVSLMEELEAVDWYDQRVRATADPELKAILMHNRDEEKEHAAMTLEWLRRRDATFADHLRTYLFSEGPIGAREAMAAGEHGQTGEPAAPTASDGSLGIGSLRAGEGVGR